MVRSVKALRRRWRIRGPDRRLAMGVAAVIALAALAALAACQPVQPASAAVQTAAHDIRPVSDVADVEEVAADAEPLEAVQAVQAGENAPAHEPPDAAQAEQGLAVYRAQYCGVCHTLAAAGTKGTFGPPHDGVGTAAGERIREPNYSGEAQTPAEYLYESLVKPDIYFVDGYISSSHRMPPYTHLSEDDLQALVAFLLAQQ